ncbi:MAG: Zn-dependent oxidoreductase [Thermoleophilia bacterium]|nr:Zn-dependent oxidoreductase [Thermoleophilia bacterium]
MLSIRCVRFSPDDPLAALELADAPEPDVREGWEVVELRAASLNHHDLWTLRGVGAAEANLPIQLGTDLAGVTADGREVVVYPLVGGTDQAALVSEGMHILSEQGDPGTLAERVAVPPHGLVPKPAGLSFAEAACLPTAYLTAWRMLFVKAALREGDAVLVQGAGGGVATAAILLGAAAGLRVYATSRSEERRSRAVTLGATAAVEPGGRLPERVDAVIETVGKATWAHSLKSLRAGGTVVVSGATSGPDPSADLARMFWRQLDVRGSTMGTLEEFHALLAFLERTGVRPLVDSTFPLADAHAAFERLASGDAFGKVVLAA